MKQRILALLLIAALLVIPAGTALAAPEDAFDVKFSGVIEAGPTDGAWTIAGFTVKTDAGTLVQVFGADEPAVGMWADVTAKRTGEKEFLALKLFVRAAELRLVGPLTSMDDETGEWIVAGVTVMVTEDTKRSLRGLPIVEGGWVEVLAAYVDDVLTVTHVAGVAERDEVELHGAIEAFSATQWTLSGIDLAVTADTKVMGTPVVGLLAHAAATLTEEGLVAKRLTVQWLEPKRGLGPAQFRGKIEKLPTEGLIGEWTVEGRKVLVSDATRILQLKGLAEVGATVHVIGKLDGETVHAFIIIVVSSPSAAKAWATAGRITALPAEGLIGEWKVNDKPFTVTAQTRIEGADKAAVGAIVFVQGVEKTDGTRVAVWIKVKAAHDVAPVPPQK